MNIAPAIIYSHVAPPWLVVWWSFFRFVSQLEMNTEQTTACSETPGAPEVRWRNRLNVNGSIEIHRSIVARRLCRTCVRSVLASSRAVAGGGGGSYHDSANRRPAKKKVIFNPPATSAPRLGFHPHLAADLLHFGPGDGHGDGRPGATGLPGRSGAAVTRHSAQPASHRHDNHHRTTKGAHQSMTTAKGNRCNVLLCICVTACLVHIIRYAPF